MALNTKTSSPSVDIKEKINEILSKMTLEEKATLTSGSDFWNTLALQRFNIPSVSISDGPNGIRKQDGSGRMGLHESLQSISFPSGSLSACSFDRELINLLGQTLGKECQTESVDILLGPSMNIKRSPLNGRNQEYYSEDPYLSGELAGAYVDGVQSTGTLSTPKHFYANNMEERRLTTSSEIDERTEREIYLYGFERLVKNHVPAAIMSSYNKVNGVYVSESYEALTKILRQEWKFSGFVMSDWGAVNDRVNDLKAGLDLEMPSSHGSGPDCIIKAIKEGILEESVLDKACERILTAVFKVKGRDNNATESYDWEKDHQIARKIASESMVLLKNEESVLPLNKKQKIAFIGQYAKAPRCLGGGSSHVTAYRISSAFDVAVNIADVIYAKGFDDSLGKSNVQLIKEAVAVAKSSDIVVLFIGLPDCAESEGFDRSDMNLPPYQNELVDAVTAVQENVVVIVHGGSPVEMPWIDKVKGVIESYLAGEAVGEAQCDILFGAVNPSGRLAESFPIRVEDNPSYLNFRPVNGKVEYAEGVFVGYRYY